jgi:(R,R)-butanediol dehydrogenase/meso-butanediol dehydrogenase/diacetyl reductase
MEALVFYGVHDIRFEPNWPDPRDPGPGEVKIAVSWGGICGTDMEDYEHGAVIPIDEPNPLSGRMAPLVLGHEFSGRIAEKGAGVEGLEVGQRVAVECVRTCMQCPWCRQGEYPICENLVSIGQQDDGGLAEYVVVPANNCIPIPDALGEDVAALAEPLAVMVRAVRKGRTQVGDVVTVVGAGAIGLCGITAAKAAGASNIIAIAHGGKRAQVAAQVGAMHVLNSKQEGWEEEYYDLTHGIGSDVVIDAGGNIQAMRLAVVLTRRQGRCVIASVVDADFPVPGLDVLLGEKEIIGSVGHSTDREFQWALQLLADGRVDLEPMITGRIALQESLEQGFERLKTDRDQIKILVTPHDDWVK